MPTVTAGRLTEVEPEWADRPVDERTVRLVQGVVAVVLLASFVFAWRWGVPLVALVVAVGAVRGPGGNPMHVLVERIGVLRGQPAPGEVVPVAGVHALDLVAATLLGVATLFLLIGFEPLAWACSLGEAAIAAITASTGYNAAAALLDRARRRD